MKNTTKTLAIAIIILIATITANAKEKIGVFDSRAIAIWNFNTDEFRKEMKAMMDQLMSVPSALSAVPLPMRHRTL